MSARREERGAATVLVLAIALAVVAGGAIAAMAGAAVQLRHRGAFAADAAALAAAVRSPDGSTAACAVAAEVARAGGGRLTSCAVHGSIADVIVEVECPRWLQWSAPIRLNARAGPAETYPDEPAPLGAPS